MLNFPFQYLDRIGQLFFGIPPPKPVGGGLFGKLFPCLLEVEIPSACGYAFVFIL